jgi:uncharacterized protein YecA (UPF0149 family)
MEIASEKVTTQALANMLVRATQRKSNEIGGGAVNPFKLGNITRNGPCPCGSGRKLKRCCMVGKES